MKANRPCGPYSNGPIISLLVTRISFRKFCVTSSLSSGISSTCIWGKVLEMALTNPGTPGEQTRIRRLWFMVRFSVCVLWNLPRKWKLRDSVNSVNGFCWAHRRGNYWHGLRKWSRNIEQIPKEKHKCNECENVIQINWVCNDESRLSKWKAILMGNSFKRPLRSEKLAFKTFQPRFSELWLMQICPMKRCLELMFTFLYL